MINIDNKVNKGKTIALKYVKKRFEHDYSECEIIVEDNGVFWVVIFKSECENLECPEVIIKKRNGKVVNCFINNRPKY